MINVSPKTESAIIDYGQQILEHDQRNPVHCDDLFRCKVCGRVYDAEHIYPDFPKYGLETKGLCLDHNPHAKRRVRKERKQTK